MWKCVICVFFGIVITNICIAFNVRHKSRRICVIGAGYSGLGTARYLQQYGLNFTVFEATKYVGGNWRFDPHVGQDEDGVPVFTSMYKGLRTNTPRQSMEYAGFPLPENFPLFPSGVCFYKYLLKFTQHFHLLNYIQFSSLVTSIKWNSDQWELTYKRTHAKNKTTEACSFVVIATGLFNKPNIPKFEGQQSFKGKIIHSHDYRNEEPYVGRKVVIVGDGPSGVDVAMLLANVTSKIMLSHHHNFDLFDLPESIYMKPDIHYFTTDGIIFQDGSFEEVDDVILCTGFGFDHEFLHKSTGLASSSQVLMPLYYNVVNIKHPSMVFVGKSKTSFLNLYDAQAEYVAALAADKFRLPSEESMLRNWLEQVYMLLLSGQSINDVNAVMNIDNYFTELLSKEAGLNRTLPNIDAWFQDVEDNDSHSSEDNVCPEIS